jgi:hypothetical protein
VHEACGTLVPLPLGLDRLQLEGVGDGLTGHGQRQGQAPWLERRLQPWLANLRRASLQIMRVGAAGGDGRGHACRLQERLQRARPLGVDLVQTIPRLVQPDPEFDLPAHTVASGHLQWAEPRRPVREENAGAFRRLDADEPEVQRLRGPADMDIGIQGPAGEAEELRLEEGIKVSAREELLGHLPMCDVVNLGLPVVLQAAHETHLMRVASPATLNTGVAKIGQEPTPPPGLVDGEMPAVMLPRGAAMVAHRRPAAAREHLMALERRLVPGPRTRLAQGVTHRDRRGINEVPILHATERCGQLDLLRSGLGQRARGQGRHTLFERRLKPPIASGTRHVGDCTLQRRPQPIRLIGAAWGPGRDHHGPHAHRDITYLDQGVRGAKHV